MMVKKISMMILCTALLLQGICIVWDADRFRFEALVTVKDGVATYADGDLSFSWGTRDWNYTYKGEYPVLTRYQDGLEYTFTIMDCHSGMAEDLGEYAVREMGNYFGDSVERTKYAAVGLDDTFFDRDYAGVCTGVRDLTAEEGVISLVFGITDMSRSAVLGVVVRGNPEKLDAIYEANYAGGRNNGVITQLAGDVLSSFRFAGADTV